MTAWVLQFVSRLRKQRDLNGQITVQEIEEAKSLWESMSSGDTAEITHKVKKNKEEGLDELVEFKARSKWYPQMLR